MSLLVTKRSPCLIFSLLLLCQLLSIIQCSSVLQRGYCARWAFNVVGETLQDGGGGGRGERRGVGETSAAIGGRVADDTKPL